MREHTYCYFHVRWHRKGMQVNAYFKEQQILVLPTLEDANSIQVGLAEVMRQLATQMIDHRTAALLLYALQIASANVKFTSFEPEQPTQVVIAFLVPDGVKGKELQLDGLLLKSLDDEPMNKVQ